jgi:hypothetical protein
VRAAILAIVLAAAGWSAGASDAVVAWSGNSARILVAHDSRIEAFDREGLRRIWSVDGVPHPAAIAVSQDGASAAVVDPLSNRVVLLSVADGRGAELTTGTTPLDALFVGPSLFLLERDASQVERIGLDQVRTTTAVAPDPAFIRRSGSLLYVYSRSGGALQEIDSASGRLVRSAAAGPAASDLQVDGSYAYLVHPQRGSIQIVDLRTMRAAGEIAVGAVPTSLALIHGGTAITASRIAVADPAAKRVWQIEGAQSEAKAVARGFLRGLIGLGLFPGRGGDYPTGVDRVIATGRTLLAYDSSGRTLYRETNGKPTAIATGLGPASFAVTGDSVVTWENGLLQRH